MSMLAGLLERELECPICREQLNNPKIAGQCGHTFCQDCLWRHIQTSGAFNTSFFCPFCRLECRKPNTAIELATNFTVKKIIESFNVSKEHGVALLQCHLCERSDNVFFAKQACAACDGILLCSDCGREHKTRKDTKDHEITGVCEPHGKPLRFFCRTCDSVLCVLCRWPGYEFQDHSQHDVVAYQKVVATCKDNLRTALRITRKESKTELDEKVARLSYLMKEETKTWIASKQEIDSKVKNIEDRYMRETRKRDDRIKMLRREIERLQKGNQNTEEHRSKLLEFTDKILGNLDDQHERQEDDLTMTREEVRSLKTPLLKEIKHGERLMADKVLMPELRGDICDTTKQLHELAVNVSIDRLVRISERLDTPKPVVDAVIGQLDELAASADLSENDPCREFSINMSEKGMEYCTNQGKNFNSSSCGFQDLNIPNNINRVTSVLYMSSGLRVGCGQSSHVVYCLWSWCSGAPTILATDPAPLIYLAEVSGEEIVVLRGEQPHLRVVDVKTKEQCDIRLNIPDASIGSLWQVVVLSRDRFIVTYDSRNTASQHHIAIVNRGGDVIQDMEVARRGWLTYSRDFGLVVSCSFHGNRVSTFNFHKKQGLSRLTSVVHEDTEFNCTDICSGIMGDVYVVGTVRTAAEGKEIRVYRLKLIRRPTNSDDARPVIILKGNALSKIQVPGLNMKSKWPPKCSIGLNNLLTGYSNLVRVIKLQVEP